jgi:hypothetical protein
VSDILPKPLDFLLLPHMFNLSRVCVTTSAPKVALLAAVAMAAMLAVAFAIVTSHMVFL